METQAVLLFSFGGKTIRTVLLTLQLISSTQLTSTWIIIYCSALHGQKGAIKTIVVLQKLLKFADDAKLFGRVQSDLDKNSLQEDL